MKKILFALILLSSSATAAFAQQAAAPTPGNQARFELISKTNELEAALNRNKMDMAQAVLPTVTGIMQTRIAQNSNTMVTLNGDDKKKLGMTVRTEQNLYSQAKNLAADPMKNKKELIATVRKFIEIY